MAVVELNIKAKREQPTPPPKPVAGKGISLELGKSYRNGFGNETGPLVSWLHPTHQIRPVLMGSKDNVVYYADTGEYVGYEGNPHGSHLVSEVWEYEKEEKAWKEGKDIEFMDPTGIRSKQGVWKSVLSYDFVCKHWGNVYAETHLRSFKDIQYRIKQ